MQHNSIIPFVEAGSIKPPDDKAINCIQSHHVVTASYNEAQKWQIQINNEIYAIATHWVFKKKYKPNHKIPVKRKIAKAVEPLGNFLVKLLELCIQAHQISEHQIDVSDYKNGVDFFIKIMDEMKGGDLVEILSPNSQKQGKTNYVTSIRDEIKKLHDRYENPYNPQTSKHTFKLIQICFFAIDKLDYEKFYKEYYRPFLTAYRQWARELRENKNFQYLTVKNGELFIQEGRGKGKIKLTPKKVNC